MIERHVFSSQAHAPSGFFALQIDLRISSPSKQCFYGEMTGAIANGLDSGAEVHCLV